MQQLFIQQLENSFGGNPKTTQRLPEELPEGLRAELPEGLSEGLRASSENLGEEAILATPSLDAYKDEARVSDISGDVLIWLKNLLSKQKNEAQEGEQESGIAVAGTVQKLLGNAVVTRDGEKSALLLGDDIFANDVVVTGAKSAIGIVFIDGMEFNLGSEAELLIDEFVFDQSQSTGEQSLAAIKGAFSYQSGLLGKADPSAVTIKTALGTLGIRGTKLLGLSDYPEGTCVITLLDGKIEVTRDKSGDSIILDEPFETARMKVEWEYIDKSQLSREEVLDTFSLLFGGDESALQEFMGDKSSSLQAPEPYALYIAGGEESLSIVQLLQADG